ncbi:response regulator [Adhaeribacter aquaticus]|uniref:response regulator n=1 Tax=Adhaeribacter aquaticus TaxID=299567 RepID=UPI0004181A43|nr:response regulator [Adhaeribacter aquaticus]
MSENIRLLIIDDDEVDRITIQRSLRKVDFPATIDMAERGEEGLAMLLENSYNCILVDYRLPDTDGVELLKKIRAQGIDIPVLIVTSQGDERIAAEALRSGASDYLSKSFLTPDGVLHSVRNAIKVYEVEKERVATENALRVSKERLKEAQNLAKIGNWNLDLKNNKVFWSEELYNILEVDTEFDITLESFRSFIHPDDQEIWKKIYKEAILTKRPYQQDYRLVFPGNKIKYVNTHGTPILNDAGEVIGLAGTLQDISDRINTQIALKESEQRYLNLIETMNEGVLHVDNEQNILFANKRFCEMLGYTKEEVIGSSFYQYIPNEVVRELIYNKTLLRHKQVTDQYEIELRTKDGTLDCFLVGGSPLINRKGEVMGSLGTFTKITERKKIEEALASREKLFRTLFENAQGFICTHSLDGTILSINKAGADIIGLRPSDMIGRNFKDFMKPHVHADFDEYLVNIQESKLTTGIFRVSNNFHKTEHYLLYRNIYFQEEGKEAYVIASAQDITERITIERELKQAKIVAENSAKVKEQFLANMSHEIRTPMNGIIGLTSVLERMITDEEQKNYLHAIQSSADKLLVIINDILDFSKIESGKIEFEETNFNPKALLLECINLFEAKASENNNRLKAIIDSEVPEIIKGDPGKLSQILNNLIGNAIKFTQDGQVKIFTEVCSINRDTVVIEFTVQDTGIGIPEDKILTIFDSFTQARSDTTRRYGGTGLGLSITKKLIELQGGTISVKSIPNEGSSFIFRIPFKNSDTSAESPMIKTEEPILHAEELGQLNILLAEDNLINQLLVKKVMQDWGFNLDTSENGIEALELFNEKNYHVILMDIQMPEMDGYEAIDYIRKSKGPKSNVPIIALTAHATKGEADKCIKAGADAYVSKPFKPEALLQEIASLVRKDVNFKPVLPKPKETVENKDSSATGYTLNLDYLKEMACGDNMFMTEIITMFIQQTPDNINTLMGYANKKSWQEVKTLAHKMKSSVVLVGIAELIDIFENLQKYALNPEQTHLVPGLIERAKIICDSAIIDLKEELKLLKD